MKSRLIVMGAALLLSACWTDPAGAAVVSSSYEGSRYEYTVEPLPGESLRSFHVYSGLGECEIYGYWDLSVPTGWFFDLRTHDGYCVIVFYTLGDALAVGEAFEFSYTHYCEPCCHSWFLSDEGSNSPVANVVDDDEQHTELCNISAPWDDECGGPGLLLAPKYPQAIPTEGPVWGSFKAQYR